MFEKNQVGFDPEMEQGKHKQELFEDNVSKLVERFGDKENELKELMKDKQEIADNPSHTEDHEHVLYEIRTFKEALRRIEEGKDKEK